MNIQEKLMSRNGLATVKLAKQLLNMPVGERIPTVVEMAGGNKMAVGTTFNALRTLTNDKAIEVIPRGHLGSFLVSKNINLLLGFAGIRHFIGVMPLPHDKKYEGLATALMSQLEEVSTIPVDMAYMADAEKRVEKVLAERYDFAIVSKAEADELLKNEKLVQVTVFEKGSYVAENADTQEGSDVAVMLAAKDNEEVATLLKSLVDVAKIAEIQEKVVKGEIQANY